MIYTFDNDLVLLSLLMRIHQYTSPKLKELTQEWGNDCKNKIN